MTEPWKRKEGDETIFRTCAWSPPGCHPTGCGLQVHVKDGKVTKVEGDPDHPITKGSLCPRCLALTEYIYHPDRIIHPMKRGQGHHGKIWRRDDCCFRRNGTRGQQLVSAVGESCVRHAKFRICSSWLVLLWPSHDQYGVHDGWRLS